MPTPQFAFRAPPATVTAVNELQAILTDKRGASVSKAEAIAYAVEKAVEELKAGDLVSRMTSTELRAAARLAEDRERLAEERKREAGVWYETDSEGRTVRVEQLGPIRLRSTDMGCYNPNTGRCEPRKPDGP